MAHGRIIVDAEVCKGCLLCQPACPPNVIGLAIQTNKKGYLPVVLDDPDSKCTGCALCAVVCPEACITVYREVPLVRRVVKR